MKTVKELVRSWDRIADAEEQFRRDIAGCLGFPCPDRHSEEPDLAYLRVEMQIGDILEPFFRGSVLDKDWLSMWAALEGLAPLIRLGFYFQPIPTEDSRFKTVEDEPNIVFEATLGEEPVGQLGHFPFDEKWILLIGRIPREGKSPSEVIQLPR